jgi:arginyl-tRNA--protein-N-Asp/Glu arginylyltransferase
MAYLNWDTKILPDLSFQTVRDAYNAGYVLTRVGRGIANKTRLFRINIPQYTHSSENRRILRKVENLELSVAPLPYTTYDWSVGKLAKEFYDAHGADFSANKVKELLTKPEENNFNTLLVFKDKQSNKAVGYCIAYLDRDILHYSYPFYESDPSNPSRGLGMMTLAIDFAITHGIGRVYLGSLQRPSDTYKLQFGASEWFDGEKWQTDTTPLREILKPATNN